MFRIHETFVLETKRRQHEAFIQLVATHIRKVFPDIHPSDDDALRDMITHGIKKARNHGIENEQAVFQFLSLMAVLGIEFDQDESLPWASRILCGKGINRLESLVESTRHYLVVQDAS